MNRLFLVAACVAAFSAPAMAARPAPAEAASCSASTARSVTLAEVTGNSVALGQCVKLQGVATGPLLVEDARARYRAEARYNDPSSTGAIIGLIFTGAQPGASARADVVGRVVDCERLAAQAAARAGRGRDVIALADDSFCGRYRGRAIEVVSMTRRAPVRLTRLTRAGAGTGLGNLSTLPAGDIRDQMERAAQRLLTAIQTRNELAISALHSDPRSAMSQGDLADTIAFYTRSPLVNAVRSPRTKIEIFGWREPRWADADWRGARARTGTAESIACFSAAANAAAIWPIDSKDADNAPGRPYFCTRITLLGTGADAPVTMNTQRAANGIPEPASR